MEYNSDKDFHIVDITEQKEGHEHVQANMQGHGDIPVPRSRYHGYLKRNAILRYARRVAVIFMALVLVWGYHTQPELDKEAWLGFVVTAGVIFGFLAPLGLGRKVTAKYFIASLGIFYSLFTVSPPLMELFMAVIQTLNGYLP